MNAKPVMLDLFSGMGGASQVMVERGWRVVRVDIERRFKPTIVADVLNLPLKPFYVDLLWASPPCQEFSRWGMPASWKCNAGGKRKPDMKLASSIKPILWHFRPTFWVIENVRSSVPFLVNLFGGPRCKVDGHVFWGNLPCLLPQTKGHKWRLFPSPERVSLRAQIPREISEAVCLGVERRMRLIP